MTTTEKSVFAALIFFLLVGAGVRTYQYSREKIEPEIVRSAEWDGAKRQFESVSLKAKSVDLNDADESDLEKLNGIGAKLAEAIIEYREQRGPFVKAEDVMNIQGFRKGLYQKLRLYLAVNGKTGLPLADPKSFGVASSFSPMKPSKKVFSVVILNSASAEDLESLPTVGPKMAAKIVDYRRIHGPFKQKEELLQVKGISEMRLDKMLPYLSLE